MDVTENFLNTLNTVYDVCGKVENSLQSLTDKSTKQAVDKVFSSLYIAMRELYFQPQQALSHIKSTYAEKLNKEAQLTDKEFFEKRKNNLDLMIERIISGGSLEFKKPDIQSEIEGLTKNAVHSSVLGLLTIKSYLDYFSSNGDRQSNEVSKDVGDCITKVLECYPLERKEYWLDSINMGNKAEVIGEINVFSDSIYDLFQNVYTEHPALNSLISDAYPEDYTADWLYRNSFDKKKSRNERVASSCIFENHFSYVFNNFISSKQDIIEDIGKCVSSVVLKNPSEVLQQFIAEFDTIQRAGNFISKNKQQMSNYRA